MSRPKSTTPKNTEKNNNLGSFVTEVTPVPKVVLEDYIDIQELETAIGKSTKNAEIKELINTLVDIAITTNKQEQFLSYGEKLAINSLRKMKILK